MSSHSIVSARGAVTCYAIDVNRYVVLLGLVACSPAATSEQPVVAPVLPADHEPVEVATTERAPEPHPCRTGPPSACEARVGRWMAPNCGIGEPIGDAATDLALACACQDILCGAAGFVLLIARDSGDEPAIAALTEPPSCLPQAP